VADDALLARLHSRHSVRGFRPDPIPRETLAQLFDAAQRAPSWCNTQPWRVVLTGGEKTAQVSKAMLAAANVRVPAPDIAFPGTYPEPYLSHRRKSGGELYGAMGIAREDKAARWQAWLRNYEFFDAPHLAVVSRDRRLGEYATLDVGVWLGFVFACAETMGIQSCAMASTAAYPDVIRAELGIPEEEIILFGLALGYEDEAVPANACRTERAPHEANIRYVGWPT
jgi:nitroreductase